MAEWRASVDKTCPVHDERMVICKYGDDDPVRRGGKVVVKCPDCNEHSTVSEADARSDID